MRILLVEDDEQLVETTARALRSQGWVVDCTSRGEPVPRSLREDAYDLLILDIGLAGIDGFETLRRVRADTSLAVPVLILTARDAVEDRVRGLEGGADDYLVKPFALTELVARARALVRRSQARTSNQLQLARLRIDQESRRAYIDSEPLALSAREWDVLGFLMARAGKVVPKEHIALASNAWDQGVSDNAIEVCLSRLRAKIEPGGVQLRTVRGLGYLLEEIV
ncbi:MAG: response regulator transcription factor [Rubrivivax sp.]|nr:MAG: response regulator transcription factor [Rubrivivax sp.]